MTLGSGGGLILGSKLKSREFQRLAALLPQGLVHCSNLLLVSCNDSPFHMLRASPRTRVKYTTVGMSSSRARLKKIPPLLNWYLLALPLMMLVVLKAVSFLAPKP